VSGRGTAPALVRLSIGAGLIALVALSPALRTAGIQLQPSVPGLLVSAALVGVAASAVIRWRGDRSRLRRWLRQERRLVRGFARWGWVGLIVAALLPLWSHWAMRPPDSLTAYAALLGHIPWKDTRLHLEGALHLLDQGTFGFYSERRPLTAAWLATRLVAGGGSAAVALALQAILLGLALYVLARAVAVRRGPWAALATCGVTLGLIGGSLPTFATEPLGVTLSACALALLLSRGAARRPLYLALGVFALGLALGARPGPQLIVPAVVVWGIAIAPPGTRVRRGGLYLAAALSALVATSSVNALYGAGESSTSSNAAYTLYGLSAGSNYRQFLRDYGEATMRSQGDRVVSRWLYRKAFENVRDRPGDLLRGLTSNLRKFLGKLPANLAPTMSLAPLLSRHPIEDDLPAIPTLGAPLPGLVPLVLATGASLLFLVRTRERSQRLLWVAVTLAVLGSVPIVYGDAGFRGLAVIYPFFGAALGLGLSVRRAPYLRAAPGEERGTVLLAALLPTSLLVLGLSVPGLVRPYWPRPVPAARAGLVPQQEMLVDAQDAPAVAVSHQPRKGLTGTPWLSPADYRRLLAFGGFTDDSGIETLQPPFAVMSVYDFVTRQQYVLVAPLELLRQPTRFVRVVVHRLDTGGKVYQATAVAPSP
jgi:hypothetical protein